ncbi:hypothetical protein BH11PLA1_BH11PLA1_17800 [soil metagenome]
MLTHPRPHANTPRLPCAARLAFLVGVTALGLSLAAGQTGPLSPVNEPRRTPPPQAPTPPPPPPAPQMDSPAPPPPGAAARVPMDLAPPASAAELNPTLYPVTKFDLQYAVAVEKVASPEELANFTTVTLNREGTNFRAAQPGMSTVIIRLSDSFAPGTTFDATAIREVSRAVANTLRGRGVLAVLVGPSRDEVADDGADLRAGRTDFKLDIIIGKVGDIRTIATGDRLGTKDDKINNPAYQRIIDNSPIQKNEYLQRDELEDYGFRLNRHAGRRVDVAVAPGSDQPGDVTLDFLVNETKPWYLLFQLSNTGTRYTDDWRERFAFVHNQLTGNDDTLRLDYVTAGFAQTHSFLGQYEFPLITDKLRLNIFGAYNKFNASDVGIATENFRGESWRAGAELAYNVLQYRQFFLDAVGGARYEHVETTNTSAGITGQTNFFLPYAGVRFDRVTEINALQGSVLVEWNVGSIAGTDRAELANLGRLDATKDWTLLKYDTNYSFFLEPILFPGLYNGDVRTTSPTGWEPGMSLAHELYFSFKGQYAFGNRLIPNAEDVVGGFYSVRGYPESATAGDSSYVGTAEYRLHIPRAFGLSPDTGKDIFGNDFRYRPQEAYGYADWDLIFRTFIDAGRVTISDKRAFEVNESLVGVGAGLELQYRRNIFVRLDYGVPLRDLKNLNVNGGEGRLHFLLSILF